MYLNGRINRGYYTQQRLYQMQAVYCLMFIAVMYKKNPYHTDHLGSSTYLTDALGDIVEHNEYTPWHEQPKCKNIISEVPGGAGEPWIQGGNIDTLTDYRFTGKEQDYSKLYYFGARYYDPQVSLWMSPDPILNSYLPKSGGNDNRKLPGMGGVFNSLNLGLYTYAHQNSVRLLDFDGNSAENYVNEPKAVQLGYPVPMAVRFKEGDKTAALFDLMKLGTSVVSKPLAAGERTTKFGLTVINQAINIQQYRYENASESEVAIDQIGFVLGETIDLAGDLLSISDFVSLLNNSFGSREIIGTMTPDIGEPYPTATIDKTLNNLSPKKLLSPGKPYPTATIDVKHKSLNIEKTSP